MSLCAVTFILLFYFGCLSSFGQYVGHPSGPKCIDIYLCTYIHTHTYVCTFCVSVGFKSKGNFVRFLWLFSQSQWTTKFIPPVLFVKFGWTSKSLYCKHLKVIQTFAVVLEVIQFNLCVQHLALFLSTVITQLRCLR